jgi:hypothetical protein
VNIPQNVGPNENYIILEVVSLSLARWSQQSMPTLPSDKTELFKKLEKATNCCTEKQECEALD